MNPLIQLPRTVDTYIEGWPLKIEDHQVVSNGFMHWLFAMEKWSYWNRAVQHLQYLGFRLDAVIYYCISELKDELKFDNILALYRYEYAQNQTKLNSTTAGKIRGIIARKLESCKTWTDLYKVICYPGDFREEIQNRIDGGIKQCNR